MSLAYSGAAYDSLSACVAGIPRGWAAAQNVWKHQAPQIWRIGPLRARICMYSYGGAVRPFLDLSDQEAGNGVDRHSHARGIRKEVRVYTVVLMVAGTYVGLGDAVSAAAQLSFRNLFLKEFEFFIHNGRLVRTGFKKRC